MLKRITTITKPNVNTNFPLEAPELKDLRISYETLMTNSEGFVSVDIVTKGLVQTRTETWKTQKDLSQFLFNASRALDLGVRRKYIVDSKISVSETIEGS